MKPLLTAAILAAAALVFGATLVWLCYKPSSGSSSFSIPSTGQRSAFSTPATVRLVKPQPLQLRPGVPQTQSPSFGIVSKDQGFALSKPVPLHLGRSSAPTHLRPGVYQTYPYSIILMVPPTGIDDGILGRTPNANFRMPVMHPHLEAIPKS